MASLFLWHWQIPCLLALLALGGCSNLPYFAQAVAGQIELGHKQRPVADVISAPDTPPVLAERLRWAWQMRDFASTELHLPDNNSYRQYADLQRNYVVWNVVATPEFAFTPTTQCFPLAGCLPYQGFFDKHMAEEHAQQLRQQGHDVWLYGVSAYSTLGWLDDPLLNTFTRYGEISMARLMFHELAHQQVYVKDDSAFNEAFATAVELEGTQRWIARYGSAQQAKQLQQGERSRTLLQPLLDDARRELERLYAQPLTLDEKRQAKQAYLQRLADNYRQTKQQQSLAGVYDHRFQPLPINAYFASLATYHRLVPAFRQLLRQCQQNWPCFYQQVRQLAAHPKPERDRQLAQLMDSGKTP